MHLDTGIQRAAEGAGPYIDTEHRRCTKTDAALPTGMLDLLQNQSILVSNKASCHNLSLYKSTSCDICPCRGAARHGDWEDIHDTQYLSFSKNTLPMYFGVMQCLQVEGRRASAVPRVHAIRAYVTTAPFLLPSSPVSRKPVVCVSHKGGENYCDTNRWETTPAKAGEDKTASVLLSECIKRGTVRFNALGGDTLNLASPAPGLFAQGPGFTRPHCKTTQISGSDHSSSVVLVSQARNYA